MRDLLSWNLPLGRWAGVNVRLHVFFLILGLVFWQAAIVSDDPSLRWNYALMLGVLLISVLVHETAHVATSARLGYIPEQVVLWPLGGLAHVGLPHQPLAELITALAGPLANLTIAAVCMLALLLTRPDLLSFNPLAPPYSDTIHGPLVLAIAFWVNWVLVLALIIVSRPARAQFDVAGQWGAVGSEDARAKGAEGSHIGDYTGIPLNEAGRVRAETWDASGTSLPERQAEPHPTQYFTQATRIGHIIDPQTRRLIGYTICCLFGDAERVVWVDGRPRPPEYAQHTW